MNKTTQDTINNIVWKACDTFRGALDGSQYKDYVLTMLFVKYLSDFYREKLEQLQKNTTVMRLELQKLLSLRSLFLMVNVLLNICSPKKSQASLVKKLTKY